MKTIRLILECHLSNSISSLNGLENGDVVLFCELRERLTQIQHHPKKIAFLLAAQRHFAEELKIQNKNIVIHYLKLTDPNNTGNLTAEVMRAVKEFKAERIVTTEPDDYKTKQIIQSWNDDFNIPIEIRIDDRFLSSQQYFNSWAQGKKQLRMEYFYREMRKKYNILMSKDGLPIGGQWNYDKENRKPPTKGLKSPKRISHKKSIILKEVLELVEKEFSGHFGNLHPFHYAITRQQALLEMEDFIEHILPYFGDYQDAMVKGEAYLYHSLLSSYINIGLILPIEICRKAELSYLNGKAPLNAVEGFIRQILGWREYVRGIYWLKMPEYGELNYLNAQNPLPSFYWGEKTHMSCISEAVLHTKEHAYSHHIQRLMITGNFALIAGLDVKQVQEWYLAVYSDAYEWVEMPNTLGMALFGDGGIMGSKPYAASGKYINKMSNFCKECYYNPEDMLGEKACPFNALYWSFLARNRNKLEGNQRLPYVYNTWDKFTKEKQEAILKKSALILEKMKEEKI